jgi:hypothetical protein
LQHELQRRIQLRVRAQIRSVRVQGYTPEQIEHYDRLERALEQVCEWISHLLNQDVTPGTIFEGLDTGVFLAKLAARLQQPKKTKIHASAKPKSFFARDNLETFVKFCHTLQISEDLLFQAEYVMQHPIPAQHEVCIIQCLVAVAHESHQRFQTPALENVSLEALMASSPAAMVESLPEEEEDALLPTAQDPEQVVEHLRQTTRERIDVLTSGRPSTPVTREAGIASRSASSSRHESLPPLTARPTIIQSYLDVLRAEEEAHQQVPEFLDEMDQWEEDGYEPAAELQSYVAQLRALANKTNQTSLLEILAKLQSSNEEATVGGSFHRNSRASSLPGQETVEESRFSDAGVVDEPTAQPIERQRSIVGIGSKKLEHDPLDGIVPLVDIQILIVDKNVDESMVPEGYRLLSHTYSGRSANLNKGTKGKAVYLCYKRLGPEGPAKVWKRRGEQMVLEEERPITNLMVLQREFLETTRLGSERLVLTPDGQDANLNAETKGFPIYLSVERGRGPPLTAINLFVAKKNDPFPDGYRMIIHTPDKHVANLNRGTIGRILFLLYQLQISHALEPFQMLEHKVNPASSTTEVLGGVERMKEIYYARLFAGILAALYSTNEVVVSKALDLLGIILRLGERLPLRPLTTFLHQFCDLIAGISACFRKSSRVELESVVLLLLHDIFNAYVDSLDVYTIVRVFGTCLNFRPDSSRASLLRHMVDNLLRYREVQEPEVDSYMVLREDSRNMAVAIKGMLGEMAQNVAFAQNVERDVDLVLLKSDVDPDWMQDIERLMDHVYENRNEQVVMATFLLVCKFGGHQSNDYLEVESDLRVPMEEESTGMGMERRIQSMELILHIIEHAGEFLRSKTETLQLFRRLVTSTIIRCCTTGVFHRIFFQRVLQIIVFLFRSFRHEFKMELASIVSEVLLGILRSEYAPSAQKQDILEALAVIFHQQQDLADCFYNFDNVKSLDLNLLEPVVSITSKIADGVIPSSDENSDPRSETLMRRRALENLVTMFGLMVDRVGDYSMKVASQNSPSSSSNTGIRRFSLWELDFAAVQSDKEILEKGVLYGKMGNLMEGLRLIYESSVAAGLSCISPLVSFLSQHANLFDKDDVGRFLISNGEHNSLEPLDLSAHTQLLAAVFDRTDLSSFDFLDAIRHLYHGKLGFYVPYELDDGTPVSPEEEAIYLEHGRSRLLLAFAKAYCRDNQGVFPSWYEAWRVATALVELNEAIHFGSTRTRLTSRMVWLAKLEPVFRAAILRDRGLWKGPIAGAIVTQRGSPFSSGVDEPFPRWMLEQWFESVVQRRLDEEDPVVPTNQAPVHETIEKQRIVYLGREMQQFVRAARGHTKDSILSSGVWYTSSSWRIVKGMFEVCWPSFINSLTTIIDNASRRDIIHLCLDGLLQGSKLAYRLGFEKVSQSFSDILAQMSYSYKIEAEDLDYSKSPEELQMDMVRGKYLEQDWVRTIQNEGFTDVSTTCAMLDEVVTSTKEAVRAKLNLEKLREVQQSWATEFRLVDPMREFVGQGQLSKISSNGRITPYLFVVFNDVLLYGDMSQCHQVLHLSICQIIDIPDDYDSAIARDQDPDNVSQVALALSKKTALRNAFSIRSPKKEFVVFAANAQQKNLWLTTLDKTIQELLKLNNPLLASRYRMVEEDCDETSESCRLCLRPFSSLRRRKTKCAVCKFAICPECFNSKLELSQDSSKKKKKIKACDGCCVNKEAYEFSG